MINLYEFTKECERSLILNRKLSIEDIVSAHNLSNKNKILCNPILKFIVRDSIVFEVDSTEMEFLHEEHILICRFIPLYFAFNTSNPLWSSYLLTQSIKVATNIRGINLSSIGIAFLEILRDFDTPLNKATYNFCLDISKEFVVHYRNRLNEFEVLLVWGNTVDSSNASVALLKYFLVPVNCYQPKFILETMNALINNEFFETFFEENKYLFEDLAYRQEFLECLFNHQLSKDNKDVILAAIHSIN